MRLNKHIMLVFIVCDKKKPRLSKRIDEQIISQRLKASNKSGLCLNEIAFYQ